MTVKSLHMAFRDLVLDMYKDRPIVPLHIPRIAPQDRQSVMECLESTMVSYVSPFVQRFENKVCDFTGAPYAVAMVNGTTALHIALLLAGVRSGDLVICPTLTFVATANAVRHAGAEPIFLDCEKITYGLSPEALQNFLATQSYRTKEGILVEKETNRRIAACVPVHIFGKPCQINAIKTICDVYEIPLVEDAAEALGSSVGGKACGTFGTLGVLSFNGNKVVSTGGGGMILSGNEALAKKGRHLTTTAKVPHPFEFFHDETAFNFRMPGLNASLGCAQMDVLPATLANKRDTAEIYHRFFQSFGISTLQEEQETTSNYWLNAIELENLDARNEFLESMQGFGIQCRPIWNLLHTLPMYRDCLRGNTDNAEWLQARVVNLPSSVRDIL